MNPFEMVVIIVALGILGGVVNHFFDNRGDMEASSKEHKRMQARIDEMEDRIRILERIVTDEKYDLKRQFHNLGDDK